MKTLKVTLAAIGLIALTLTFTSGTFADTKTWTTDVELGEAQLDNIKIVGTGDASSLQIGSWYGPQWAKRRQITITGVGESLENFPIKVNVAYDGDMQSDFDDLRFVSGDHKDELAYWLGSKTDGVSATVWVKVPKIGASGVTTCYMYYSNSTASSGSNAHKVFLFFDDFAGYTPDTQNVAEKGKWETNGDKNDWRISSDGVLKAVKAGAEKLKAQLSLPTSYTVECKARVPSIPTGGWIANFMFYDDSTANDDTGCETTVHNGPVWDFFSVGMRVGNKTWELTKFANPYVTVKSVSDPGLAMDKWCNIAFRIDTTKISVISEEVRWIDSYDVSTNCFSADERVFGFYSWRVPFEIDNVRIYPYISSPTSPVGVVSATEEGT